MRQKMLWCCALAGCCLGVSAGDTEGIAIPPSIQALPVDVDGDGVASTADKLLLALWVQMGGDLEAALKSAVEGVDGVLSISLPPLGSLGPIPGSIALDNRDEPSPMDGGRGGSSPIAFVAAGGSPYSLRRFGDPDRVCLAVRAGHVTGSSLPDIVALEEAKLNGPLDTDIVSILKNNGDGTFAQSVQFRLHPVYTRVNPVSLLVTDLNGDGYADIVVGCNNTGNDPPDIIVLWNKGTGVVETSFDHVSGHHQYLNIESGATTGEVRAADLNDDNDGQKDLVVGVASTINRILAFPNLGNKELNGTYTTIYNKWPVTPGYTARIQLADLTGDGLPDVAGTCGFFGENLGNWLFDWNTDFSIGYDHADNIGEALADFNNDGHIDMAAVRINTHGLFFWEHSGELPMGDGGSEDLNVFGWQGARGVTAWVGAIDVDDDQYPDLVVLFGVSDNAPGQFAIIPNNSMGISAGQLVDWFSLDATELFDLEHSSGEGYAPMVEVVDLDGDGMPDLVFPLYDQNEVVVMLNETPPCGRLPFVRGDVNDDGTVNIADPTTILNYLFAGGPEPGCRAAADANKDYTVDIADAVHLLGYLFAGGPPPPPPFPACGRTDDVRECCRVQHSCSQ